VILARRALPHTPTVCADLCAVPPTTQVLAGSVAGLHVGWIVYNLIIAVSHFAAETVICVYYDLCELIRDSDTIERY
jgi:hypothetical protein